MATKNFFGTKQFFLTVVFVLVLVGVGSIVYTVDKVFSLSKEIWRGSPEQSIFVTGTTKVKVMPDVAYVSYLIRVDNKDIKKASATLANKLDQTIAELTKSGISRSKVYLSQYQVNKALSSGPDDFSESFVSQNITVEINGSKKDLNQKLEALDKIASLNGLIPNNNGASYICLDFSDRTTFFSSARKNAVADAYRQANDLVSAGGLALGRIVNISDNMYGFGGVNSPYSNYCGTQLGSGRVIEEQEVPVSVSVTFEVR